MATINHPRVLICVDNRIGRTQLGKLQSEQNDCKTGGLHVLVFGLRPVFLRDQSSDKLINFLDSQLDTRDSRLDTRNYQGSRLEDRGSRVNLLLSSTVVLAKCLLMKIFLFLVARFTDAM